MVIFAHVIDLISLLYGVGSLENVLDDTKWLGTVLKIKHSDMMRCRIVTIFIYAKDSKYQDCSEAIHAVIAYQMHEYTKMYHSEAIFSNT